MTILVESVDVGVASLAQLDLELGPKKEHEERRASKSRTRMQKRHRRALSEENIVVIIVTWFIVARLRVCVLKLCSQSFFIIEVDSG